MGTTYTAHGRPEPRLVALVVSLVCVCIGCLMLASSSSDGVTAYHPGHHKWIAVTMQDGAGHDYPCDDSDGADKAVACQIHCVTNPCLEPYRLCLSHSECHAIAVNSDLSFATLKRDLHARVAASATGCTNLGAWEAWWANNSRTNLPRGTYAASCSECSLVASLLACAKCRKADGSSVGATVDVSGCAAATFENRGGSLACEGQAPKEEAAAYHPGGKHKPIKVTLANGAGADYPCDDSDGESDVACQIRCGSLKCLEPYRRARAEWATARSQLCLAHAECAAVALNEDLSYATLKASLYPSVAAVAVTVQTKDEWRSYLRNSSAHLTGEARDVWVASAHLGADFGCVDSEVVGKCEFACAQPHCADAYERCIKHTACEGVQLNAPLLTTASLRAMVPAGDAARRSRGRATERGFASSGWADTALVANVSQWHLAFRSILAAVEVANATGEKAGSWLGTFLSLGPLAATGAELASATQHAIVLATSFVNGFDFGCAAGDGVDASRCEVACVQPVCVNAYHHCLSLAQCLGVYVEKPDAIEHSESSPSWIATLKTFVPVNGEEGGALVLSEADWRQALTPKGRWEPAEGQLMPAGLTPDEETPP